MAQTKQSEVVRLFHKYMGKNPTSPEDWKTVAYLGTKSINEIESKLAQNQKEVFERDAATRKEATTSNIDPVKIAQNLGFNTQDLFGPQTESLDEAIDYWKNKSKAELEEALKGRGDYSDEFKRKMTPSELEDKRADDEYYTGLKEKGFTDSEIDVIRKTADGIDINRMPTEEEFQKIATKAESEARTDVADYYKDVESRGFEDIRDQYADIRSQSARFAQREAKGYAETLAETKKGLRARGLTFSGASRATLGKEAAGAYDIGEAGEAQKEIEGTLPQARRYAYEDVRAGFQESARDVGTLAERKYGSEKLYEQRGFIGEAGIADPYAKGTEFVSGRTSPVYLPKKEGQTGYVSPERADIEKERELEVQRRKEDRLKTYK